MATQGAAPAIEGGETEEHRHRPADAHVEQRVGRRGDGTGRTLRERRGDRHGEVAGQHEHRHRLGDVQHGEPEVPPPHPARRSGVTPEAAGLVIRAPYAILVTATLAKGELP
jgi:hypothetical protein